MGWEGLGVRATLLEAGAGCSQLAGTPLRTIQRLPGRQPRRRWGGNHDVQVVTQIYSPFRFEMSVATSAGGSGWMRPYFPWHRRPVQAAIPGWLRLAPCNASVIFQVPLKWLTFGRLDAEAPASITCLPPYPAHSGPPAGCHGGLSPSLAFWAPCIPTRGAWCGFTTVPPSTCPLRPKVCCMYLSPCRKVTPGQGGGRIWERVLVA